MLTFFPRKLSIYPDFKMCLHPYLYTKLFWFLNFIYEVSLQLNIWGGLDRTACAPTTMQEHGKLGSSYETKSQVFPALPRGWHKVVSYCPLGSGEGQGLCLDALRLQLQNCLAKHGFGSSATRSSTINLLSSDPFVSTSFMQGLGSWGPPLLSLPM